MAAWMTRVGCGTDDLQDLLTGGVYGLSMPQTSGIGGVSINKAACLRIQHRDNPNLPNNSSTTC